MNRPSYSLVKALALLIVPSLLSGCAGSPKLTPPLQAPVSFEREIRPLLETRCLVCHDSEGGGGDLDLTSPEAAFRSSPNGPFIVPGSPDRSRVFGVIKLANNEPGAMPPNSEHTLSQPEIDLIKQWITQGAEWPVTKPAP